jgi:Flp pilus assembly pilin Flp
MKNFNWFFFADEGVTAIEYAIIGSLIAAVIVGTVSAVGIRAETLYNIVQSALS